MRPRRCRCACGELIALRNTVSPGSLAIVGVDDGSYREIPEGYFGAVGWLGDETVFRLETGARARTDDDLVAVAIDGSAELRAAILPFRVRIRNTSMSTDGRFIVAAVVESRSDVWLVENFASDRARDLATRHIS